MKFVPNIFLRAVFFVLVLLSPTYSIATTLLNDPPPPPAPGDPVPPPLPIDGGIVILIIIAILFAGFKWQQLISQKKSRTL